jgi:hypothetical protein
MTGSTAPESDRANVHTNIGSDPPTRYDQTRLCQKSGHGQKPHREPQRPSDRVQSWVTERTPGSGPSSMARQQATLHNETNNPGSGPLQHLGAKHSYSCALARVDDRTHPLRV